MNELVDYIEQYDIGFRRTISGATPQVIRQLQMRSGHPFPDSYRKLLQSMGGQSGKFMPHHPASFQATSIIEYLDDLEPDDIPTDVVVFAADGYGVPDLGLDVSDGRDDPPVVAFEDEVVLYPVSQHLTWYLFQSAFARFRLAGFTDSISLKCESNYQPQSVFQVLEGLGFQLTWFSEDITICAERPDSAVISQALPNGAGFLRITSDNAQQLASFSQTIQAETSLWVC